LGISPPKIVRTIESGNMGCQGRISSVQFPVCSFTVKGLEAGTIRRTLADAGREKENPTGRPGFLSTTRTAIFTLRKKSGEEIIAAGVVPYWPVLAPFFAAFFLACFVCFLEWLVVSFLLCFLAAKAGIDRVVAIAIAAINVKNFFMGSRTSD
jgi:hypothetical protein